MLILGTRDGCEEEPEKRGQSLGIRCFFLRENLFQVPAWEGRIYLFIHLFIYNPFRAFIKSLFHHHLQDLPSTPTILSSASP